MEDNEIKVRKILGKSQPNFQHYITKIEVLANHWFKIEMYFIFHCKRV